MLAETEFVSGSGAFMLPIPIVVPPGRAGIQPALTLTYNSQELNSWVGVGWSLGLAHIHRNLKDGVKYEAGEYAVNNEKLIPVVAWNRDGYLGYAPEVQENFTKYFKISETEGWEVRTKDGKIYYYGTTDDSRQSFIDGNDTHVFKWCLKKVVDSNGNYMEVTYTEDNGQIYLSKIDYTGNGSTDPTKQIIFHLEDIRTDHNSNYVANYEIKTKKRLKSIEVRNDNALVRAYGLDYWTSPHSSRSRLISVTQYDSNASIDTEGNVSGTSLPPHRFEYENLEVDKSHFEATTSKSGDLMVTVKEIPMAIKVGQFREIITVMAMLIY